MLSEFERPKAIVTVCYCRAIFRRGRVSRVTCKVGVVRLKFGSLFGRGVWETCSNLA